MVVVLGEHDQVIDVILILCPRPGRLGCSFNHLGSSMAFHSRFRRSCSGGVIIVVEQNLTTDF
jgi:hypothetical protein